MRYLLIFLWLAACAPAPAPADVLSRFSGHSADDFFLEYGRPVESRTAESGRVYRWVSILETDTAMTGRYLSMQRPGSFAFPDAYPKQAEPRFCSIQMDADASGRIRRMMITHDAPGKWSASLCGEIFSPPHQK